MPVNLGRWPTVTAVEAPDWWDHCCGPAPGSHEYLLSPDVTGYYDYVGLAAAPLVFTPQRPDSRRFCSSLAF